MSETATPPGSWPFCALDANGRVVMRGQTMAMPQFPGLTVLAQEAPPDVYRGADGWVQMPLQPSEHHTFDWTAKVWVDRSLEQLRTAKLAEINRSFSTESAALIAGYPVEERQTWAAQEAEALAWAADHETPTPYLDGIASARGIDPADMRARTFDAVKTFRTESQWLVGTRQALRDAIQNPDATREQIAAVAWPTFQE
ncbi:MULTISPECIES: hypothetical protein [unclassified Variovorax]|uniref:hypothetical protein n=1 Tax=unclassified Variovorax TaxID=663243 RepID=UPI002578FB25|nr:MULTISPECIES: hypothetical protein [unclassified Variovorax]MDM0086745.1 hypothetical protein [Variovorax sp. J22G40]MDM0144999.1 hypothetical protein [Variovorax sp. J2P1-31]